LFRRTEAGALAISSRGVIRSFRTELNLALCGKEASEKPPIGLKCGPRVGITIDFQETSGHHHRQRKTQPAAEGWLPRGRASLFLRAESLIIVSPKAGMRLSCDHHEQMLAHIAAGSIDGVRALMEEHLGSALEIVLARDDQTRLEWASTLI
jgi:hypothetical protein